MYLRILIFFSLAALSATKPCKTPDNEEGECILLKLCPRLSDLLTKQPDSATEYVQKSICGFSGLDSLVCCVSNKTELALNSVNSTSKQNLLPDKRYCGYQHSDDYVRGDTSIGINEFPWQAILFYNLTNSGNSGLRAKCSGALISNRYVITAGHCINPRKAELINVRLGEYYIKNTTDCTVDSDFYECSDAPKEFGVEKKLHHPGFNQRSSPMTNHDIGLLRLDRNVQYSDYIRPICLPFPGTKFAEPGDIVFLSGFGVNPNTKKSTDIKKKISLEFISNTDCISYYNKLFRIPPDYIQENHFCTLITETSNDLSCIGDNGGAVMYSYRNQWHLEGISSFGNANCTLRFPEVHTKVSKYLNWILENIEP